MGYIQHTTIVVTSWKQEHLIEAHGKARDLLDGLVSPIVPGRMNGYASFFISPDGSKLGWGDDVKASNQRLQFIDWLHDNCLDSAPGEDDARLYLKWVHIRFGRDDGEELVVLHETNADRLVRDILHKGD